MTNTISLFSFIRSSLILTEDITKRVLDIIKTQFKVPNPNPTVPSMYKNNIPKTEEELNTIIKHFESLSPDSKNSNYVQFLAQTAFSNPPSWVVNEDEPAVIGELKEYNALLLSKKLTPPENQITYFKSIPALRQFLQQKKEHIQTNFSGVEEHEQQEVKTIAKIIDTVGDWTVVKIPKGSDPKTLRAAYLLCSNKRHGSSWCVGWEDGKSLAGNYLPQGDFYLFQKNNISVYAVSTIQDRSLILWNRADSPLVNTEDLGSKSNTTFKGLLPSLDNIITKFGKSVPEFYSYLSHVPEEIRPVILKLQINPEAKIFNTMPKTLLGEMSTDKKDFIFKVLHAVNKTRLIEDINTSIDTQGTNIILTIYALLTYIVMPHKGIIFTSDELYSFNWKAFMAYIEAHANANDRNMSKEIHDTLLKVIDNAPTR